MKLTWHIIWKDIRSHRWALLVWALFVVAQIALGLVAQNYHGADMESVRMLQQANTLLMFMQFVTGYILVARFVQADALTGTHMFWVTRPISAKRLLAAKVLGIVLVFAVVPVLLLLPWWLWCGFGARDILWGAVDAIGWQLLMIAPAFLVASLTDDLGRVLMWTSVIITVLCAGIIMLQAKLGISFGDAYRSSRAGALFTRLWLAAIVLVIGAIVIGIHQFLTRRSVRSIVLAVAHIGLVVIVGSIKWGDWSEYFDGDNDNLDASLPDTPGLADGMTFSVESAQEISYSLPVNPREAQKELQIMLRVRGVPEDLKLWGGSFQQNWHWAGSPDFKDRGFGGVYGEWNTDARWLRAALSLPEPSEDPETKRWHQARFAQRNAERLARGLQPLAQPIGTKLAPDEVVLRTHTWLPVPILARMQVEPSVYHGTMEGAFARTHIVVELPAKPGSRGSSESLTFRVLAQEEDKAILVTTSPSVRKSGLWQGLMGKRGNWMKYYSRGRLMLVNRTTGDVSEVGGGSNDSPHLVQIGGVVIDWKGLTYYPNAVRRGEQWLRPDPQWLEHSSLVLLIDRGVGLFTREVKMDKFIVTRPAGDDVGPEEKTF